MKRSLLIWIFLICIIQGSAQFEFEDDPVYRPMYARFYDVAKEKFKLSQNFDFEFRYFVTTFVLGRCDVLILIRKDGQWTYRHFKNLWEKESVYEQPLPSFNVDSLWGKLLQYNVLTIPNSGTLKDSIGSVIRGAVNDGTHYEFEFLAPGKRKHYDYHSPGSYAKMYPYIREYSIVASMIDFIHAYCKLEVEQ